MDDVAEDMRNGVPVFVAARTLGISVAAVKQRIRRKTLQAYKADDEWRVVLPVPHADRNAERDTIPAPYRELIDVLRGEVDRWRQEAEQKNMIIASLVRQLPAPRAEPEPAAPRPRPWWRFWGR